MRLIKFIDIHGMEHNVPSNRVLDIRFEPNSEIAEVICFEEHQHAFTVSGEVGREVEQEVKNSFWSTNS